MSTIPKKTNTIISNPLILEDAACTTALKIEANVGQLSSMTKMDCINEIYSIVSEEMFKAVNAYMTMSEDLDSKQHIYQRHHLVGDEEEESWQSQINPEPIM